MDASAKLREKSGRPGSSLGLPDGVRAWGSANTEPVVWGTQPGVCGYELRPPAAECRLAGVAPDHVAVGIRNTSNPIGSVSYTHLTLPTIYSV